jgi:hypothetical protein
MGTKERANGTIKLDVTELLGFSQVAKVSEAPQVPSADLGRLLSKMDETKDLPKRPTANPAKSGSD